MRSPTARQRLSGSKPSGRRPPRASELDPDETQAAVHGNELALDALKKFRVLFSSIKMHYREVESSCGISGSQLWVLTEIGRCPGMRVSELATCLLIHQSTASNLLDGLDDQSLITKFRTKEDQRVVRLRVTAKGRRLLDAAPGPTVGVLLDALEQMPKETLLGLTMHLEDLTAMLNRKDVGAESTPLADL
jgi:DNA-binding MarR family transcriptional regulator